VKQDVEYCRTRRVGQGGEESRQPGVGLAGFQVATDAATFAQLVTWV
jgi:hypothetical protein